MQINNRLYFDDVMSQYLTNIKDARTVEAWCKKNNVSVLKDGLTRYCWDEDFELAFFKDATPEQKMERMKIKPWIQFVIEDEVKEELMPLKQVKTLKVISTPKPKVEDLKPLVIPPDKQIVGLYVGCQQCTYDERGSLTKPYKNCSHPIEKQVFIAKIHIKGTKTLIKKEVFQAFVM